MLQPAVQLPLLIAIHCYTGVMPRPYAIRCVAQYRSREQWAYIQSLTTNSIDSMLAQFTFVLSLQLQCSFLIDLLRRALHGMLFLQFHIWCKLAGATFFFASYLQCSFTYRNVLTLSRMAITIVRFSLVFMAFLFISSDQMSQLQSQRKCHSKKALFWQTNHTVGR